MRKFLSTVFFLILLLNLNAQEIPDSIHIEINKKQIEYAFDVLFFEQFLPLSGTFNSEHIKVSQFLTDESIKNVPFLNTHQSHNIFLYKTPMFEYWQTKSPLSMGFLFNLDQVTRWEKLNVFIDGSTHLANSYELNEEGHAVQTDFERGVFWKLGTGATYEYSPGKKLFIKSSVQFKDFNPVGSRHSGGVKVNF